MSDREFNTGFGDSAAEEAKTARRFGQVNSEVYTRGMQCTGGTCGARPVSPGAAGACTVSAGLPEPLLSIPPAVPPPPSLFPVGADGLLNGRQRESANQATEACSVSQVNTWPLKPRLAASLLSAFSRAWFRGLRIYAATALRKKAQHR
ncbi:hypothetical protein SKAU_G00252020 [Synaphobranchus kaupii]|uniref:Uncharacterized protein n=1 Tax=Synaphobranchus kaupii TaxID=118154 RepID=A0A9Q1F3F9_SYNKA|nr:hypothetical protein SKAU_G00252020 [Synaphobranchus kaupii]